jgi:hypothetical protein
MKTDCIRDYILRNAHSLRIATVVAQAWPEAREHLVGGFLARLHSRLAKKLKAWRFEAEDRFFTDPYASYHLWKPAWENQFHVTLQFGKYGQEMTFGVSLAAPKRRGFCAELLDAVKKHYPSAHQQSWWEARVRMQSPAPDWRVPDVLWRMHTDKEFLDDVAEQLLDVAKIAQPIVDRLVRKK